jgi:hypothetical protein
MEFIPLLVDAVQQQGRTIDSLKSSIAEIQENGQISFENKVQSSSNSKIIGLSQNHSGDLCFIDFFVDAEEDNAIILIKDKEGRLIKSINIEKVGYGQSILNCSSITSGEYMICLYTNAQIISTRKFILP